MDTKLITVSAKNVNTFINRELELLPWNDDPIHFPESRRKIPQKVKSAMKNSSFCSGTKQFRRTNVTVIDKTQTEAVKVTAHLYSLNCDINKGGFQSCLSRLKG